LEKLWKKFHVPDSRNKDRGKFQQRFPEKFRRKFQKNIREKFQKKFPDIFPKSQAAGTEFQASNLAIEKWPRGGSPRRTPSEAK
jgi:hypothetical protein